MCWGSVQAFSCLLEHRLNLGIQNAAQAPLAFVSSQQVLVPHFKGFDLSRMQGDFSSQGAVVGGRLVALATGVDVCFQDGGLEVLGPPDIVLALGGIHIWHGQVVS